MSVRAALVALASATVAVNPASSVRPNAAAAITAEVTRIEKDIAAMGERAEAVADGMARVKDAVQKGRLYLALDELQEPWTYQAAWTWSTAHATIKTADAFSTEWKRIGEPVLLPSSARVPAAVEAIAAANAIRAPATWRASLPYSEDAGMGAGLYYLGEAQAFSAFATFCRALPFARDNGVLVVKPMGSEIGSLEAEAAAMYERASAETRPRFIRVSVALKIARSLDDHGDHGAALYQYLAAKYRMSVAAGGDAPAPEVTGQLRNARALLPKGQDHSIAELFIQRAEYLLEMNDPAGARSAAVIANTVLPAYMRLISR